MKYLAAFLIAVSAFAATPANLAPGKKVTFEVTHDGDGPFTYQWKRNGADIAGATSRTYVITNVQTSHAGSYSVVITNAVGSLRTGAASLEFQLAVTKGTVAVTVE